MQLETTAIIIKFSKYLYLLTVSNLHRFEDNTDPNPNIRILLKYKHGGFIKTLQLLSSDKFSELVRTLTPIHLIDSRWLHIIDRNQFQFSNFLIFFGIFAYRGGIILLKVI
jgi:hypothetical protein